MRLAVWNRRIVRGRAYNRRVRRLFAEGLELRALLAGVTCDLTDGSLNVWGTPADDQIAVQMASDSNAIVVADRGRVIERFAASDVRSVCIQADSGNDRITIDALLLSGSTVDGGDGEDVLLQLHSGADVERTMHHHGAGSHLTAVEQVFAVRQIDAEGEDEAIDSYLIFQLEFSSRGVNSTHFEHGISAIGAQSGWELHQTAVGHQTPSVIPQVETISQAKQHTPHDARIELDLMTGDDTSSGDREHGKAFHDSNGATNEAGQKRLGENLLSGKWCITTSTLILVVPGENLEGQATCKCENTNEYGKAIPDGSGALGFFTGDVAGTCSMRPRLEWDDRWELCTEMPFDDVKERFLNHGRATEGDFPMMDSAVALDSSYFSPKTLDHFHRLGVTLFAVGSVMFIVNAIPRRLLEDQPLAMSYASVDRFYLPPR